MLDNMFGLRTTRLKLADPAHLQNIKHRFKLTLCDKALLITLFSFLRPFLTHHKAFEKTTNKKNRSKLHTLMVHSVYTEIIHSIIWMGGEQHFVQ